MLSQRSQRNTSEIIPRLLREYHQPQAGNIDILDLSQAENSVLRDETLDEIRSAIGKHLNGSNLSYPTGVGGELAARKSLAMFFNDRFNPARSVSPDHIVMTPGASEALETLIFHICDPGEGVLIAAPYWSGLDLALETRSLARIVQVNIPLHEFFEMSSIQYYERALATSPIPIKAILMCNPHNPLGQCYNADVLEGLLGFCQRNKLHYISDEVYGMSVFSDSDKGVTPAFTSILSHATAPGLTSWVHMVYSLSKDFGCSGLRLGAIVTQGNTDLLLGSALITNNKVSSLTSVIVPSLLEPRTTQKLLNQNLRSRLNLNYGKVQRFLENRGLEFVPAKAGLFVFACLGKTRTEKEQLLLIECMKRSGVKLVAGTSFHFEQFCWFRIMFSLPKNIVDVALQRIGDALDETEKLL
ncbi:similar to 1-aminocyclopropane-1-carboxylate synthase 1 [Plenodomus lingam JN3]|uniref:Probable aminotransferase sirI n=2 Tax=Leptosphaeria maculans TaxID=5022 RepID=SIRI_LEPMC|nr:similar to 1-aminocyclopropane-1-carboxylate synthase 1 [Plenodomus lingam JN3]Q6Q887.1 RecName: Full=Probable aminotransferase sirI; AltName: Full=Sirodesmin biosynthesis protein I [Plenodomus lingam]AAS92541.1 SirI [Plenodomus lingam]CBX98947.1 similar to 1-aminocyclopropane-1-carboxylate synthase 1 [Plenodomus lingam JN3]